MAACARAQQRDVRGASPRLRAPWETDPDVQTRFAVLRQSLQQLGWTEGHNIQIDQHFWSTGDSDLVRRQARELVALAPDLVVAAGSPNVAALQQASPTVPIVFVGVVDPVGAASSPVSRAQAAIPPASHRSNRHEREMAGVAQRDRCQRDARSGPARSCQPRQPRTISRDAGCGPFLEDRIDPIDVRRHAPEIERTVAAFARGSNGELIVTLTAFTIRHRDLISTLAARHRLPAVYPYRYFVPAAA